MKAHEIAANLKRSRRKWGRVKLFNRHTGAFCALGIKAAESNVKPKTMEWFQEDCLRRYSYWGGLYELTLMNDSSSTKEELISDLEKHPKEKFNVEGFIRFLLDAQKKCLPQKAQHEG